MDTPAVTRIEVHQHVRPGKYTVKDHDYRKPPPYPLMKSAQGGLAPEAALELFHYVPGGLLFKQGGGGDTPTADDRGVTRTDEKEGELLAQRRLDAKRGQGKRTVFVTNAFDVGASTIVSFFDHARSDVGMGKTWLVQHAVYSGAHAGEWTLRCESVSTDIAYRPPLKTPKPTVEGTESATIVGPPGEEIHVDEFGRVRVQFHWDRYGSFNEESSIHVNQPWSGTGYGGTQLPRASARRSSSTSSAAIPIARSSSAASTPSSSRRRTSCPTTRPRAVGRATRPNPDRRLQRDQRSRTRPARVVRMQAEKDRDTVKNNETLTVGNNRMVSVGDSEKGVGNNAEGIVGNEAVVVGGYRVVVVDGEFEESTSTTRTSSRSRRPATGSSRPPRSTSHSKMIQFKADDKIELICGKDGTTSTITMTPT